MYQSSQWTTFHGTEHDQGRNSSWMKHEKPIPTSQPSTPWMHTASIYSTPLSQEELTLWKHVRNNEATIKDRPHVYDGTDIPSTDQEFQAAIESLNASTQAIERQTQILNAQSMYLSDLKATQETATQRRAGHVSYLRQREAAEAQHVTFANEQVLEQLQSDLQFECDELAKDVKSVHAIVSQVLNADDCALDELNNLSAGRSKPPLDAERFRQRVEQLMAALQHFQIQAVKDRLDCTYMQSLGETHPDSHPLTVTVEEVKEDLSSLYAEIDDVVIMAARHEYLDPIDASLRKIGKLREVEGKAVAGQIHARMSSLTDSLEHLSSKLENLHSQRIALQNLLSRVEPLERRNRLSSRPTSTKSSTKAMSNAILGGTAQLNPSDTDNSPSRPALCALLNHLDFSPPESTTSKPNDALLTQIETRTTNFQNQSAEHISRILSTSESAAVKRRRVLEDVGACLAGDKLLENDAYGVAALEEAIKSARTDLERKG